MIQPQIIKIVVSSKNYVPQNKGKMGGGKNEVLAIDLL